MIVKVWDVIEGPISVEEYPEEAPDGEDLVYAVEYDGEEIDNDGGDTTGKGYYAYFWKQG